jgi:hypothetical protein
MLCWKLSFDNHFSTFWPQEPSRISGVCVTSFLALTKSRSTQWVTSNALDAQEHEILVYFECTETCLLTKNIFHDISETHKWNTVLTPLKKKKEVVYEETTCETKTFSIHLRHGCEMSMFEKTKKRRTHEVNIYMIPKHFRDFQRQQRGFRSWTCLKKRKEVVCEETTCETKTFSITSTTQLWGEHVWNTKKKIQGTWSKNIWC